MYSMILAMDENNLIGKGDQLPWDLPEDLQHFKSITLDKIIVMGKKTFDSIGRPLPKRLNVVITRDKSFSHEGVVVFHSIEEFDAWALEQEKEIIVIGGANLISQMYSSIDTLYLTHIHNKYEGDCYVDFIDYSNLSIVELKSNKVEDGFDVDFTFCTYRKKS